MLDVGGAAVGGLEPLLGARLFGARFAYCLKGGAGGFVGIGKGGIGGGAAVGGGAARGFGRLDFADKGPPLLGKRRGRAVERGALGLRLAGALCERAGLADGADLARVPFGPLGRDRAQ